MRLHPYAFGVLLAVSGCIDLGDVKLESTLDDVYQYAGYRFVPPYAFTAAGVNTTHEWLADPGRIPHGVQVLMKTQGSDMSVAVNKKGTIFVATFDAVYATRDHGRNWTKIHDLLSDGYPVQEDRFRSAGVALHADPVTDRLFVSHLNSCSFLLWTDDEGRSWHKSETAYWPQSCVTPYQMVREQRIFSGKAGPDTKIPAPLQTYPTVLYICGTFPIVQAMCSVSFDGGSTFLYIGFPILPPASNCNIQALGHPAIAADGTVVVPIGFTTSTQTCPTFTRPTVVVSRDSGLTWDVRHYGTIEQTEIAPTVVFSTNGTAYMTVRDGAYKIRLYRSTDLFESAKGPFTLSAPGTTLSSHGTIIAGDEGRISVAYLATRTAQRQAQYYYGSHRPTPERAAQDSFWHLYVASTENATSENPVFVVDQVTPQEDPVHIGCIQYVPFSSSYERAISSAGYSCTNNLNFMESAMLPDGRFLTAMTDGCAPKNGCTTDTSGGYQARERTPSIIVQDAGMSLLSSVGLLPTLGLRAPEPQPRDCCPRGS